MIFISKRTHPFLEPVFLWTLFHTTHRDHRVIVGLPSWESDLAAWNWAPVAAPASCQSSRRARWWPTNKKKHRIWLYHIIWKKKQSKHGYIYIYLGFQSLSTANNLGCHWISRILLQKKVIISVGFMLSWALRLTPPWTKPAGEIHRWTEILSGWWLTYQPVVNILLIYG